MTGVSDRLRRTLTRLMASIRSIHRLRIGEAPPVRAVVQMIQPDRPIRLTPITRSATEFTILGTRLPNRIAAVPSTRIIMA